MRINWSAVASATSYQVDVVTSSGTETFASPVGTGITNLFYTYSGGTINTMYYAKVRAIVSGSPTSASNEVGVIVTTDKILADQNHMMKWSDAYKVIADQSRMMKFNTNEAIGNPVTPVIDITITAQDKILIPYCSGSGGNSRPGYGWMWPRTAPGRT